MLFSDIIPHKHKLNAEPEAVSSDLYLTCNEIFFHVKSRHYQGTRDDTQKIIDLGVVVSKWCLDVIGYIPREGYVIGETFDHNLAAHKRCMIFRTPRDTILFKMKWA